MPEDPALHGDQPIADDRLDCKGLRCPMPIVRISQRMKTMPAGSRLRVEANDPAFLADVRAWTRRMGHAMTLLAETPVVVVVLEKGGS